MAHRISPRLLLAALFIIPLMMVAILACEGDVAATRERASQREAETEEPTTEEPTTAPASAVTPEVSPTVAPTEPATATPEPTATPVPLALEDSRVALEALYEATSSDNWSNNEGWLVEDDISLWYGVTADLSGRVTGLQLGSNNLAGELPKELGGISELSVDLTVLNLSNNQLG